MFGRLIAGLALAWISIAGAWADSTINPLVPADNSSLSSSVLRQQFQAAINDINGLAALAGKVQAPVGVVATNDASVDNCGLINAALQVGGIYLPSPADPTAFYYSSCTITVPHGSFLYGEGQVSEGAQDIIGGSAIFCGINVSPCVVLGGDTVGGSTNIGNKSGEIRNLKIGRWGTPAPSGAVGLQFIGGLNNYIEHVVVDNHATCILLKTPPGTNSGISVFLDKIVTQRCSDAHIWNDSFPEVRLMHSRLGGTGTSNAFIRISCSQRNCTGAGTPVGLFITNTQFNAAALVDTLFEWKDASDNSTQFFAGDWGEVKMSDSHVEFINHAFKTDSTVYQVKDVSLTNNTIAALDSFFAFNTNTNLWRWSLTNNTLSSPQTPGSSLAMAAAASTANIQDFSWTGGNWGGNLTITGVGGASMNIMGVAFANNLTINGVWGAFNEYGDNISGSYTEGISSTNTNVFNNRQTKILGSTGITCNAGVSATTGRSKNGILTAC